MSDKAEQNKNEPSESQLEKCKALGWEYLGDGIFVKGERMGWFEGRSFQKEDV